MREPQIIWDRDFKSEIINGRSNAIINDGDGLSKNLCCPKEYKFCRRKENKDRLIKEMMASNMNDDLQNWISATA